MELRELLAGADVIRVAGDPDVEITGLAYDSRQATPGALFFAYRGRTVDGHAYAAAAVDAGAVAVALERELELPSFVTRVEVGDARAAMAHAGVRFFGDPTGELDVVGITGTNGKTTSAFLVRHILEQTGTPTGLLGTVKRVVGGVAEPVERTTPEAIDLQATLRRMVDAGDRACAIEVSSHALTLNRTDGIRFAVAAFTNLTQDHLDFHADMEDYFQAKRRLFVACGPRRAVINLDDAYGERLASELADALTFSAAGDPRADLRARAVSFDASGSRFHCDGPDGEVEVETALPGAFNVENALCAITCCVALGVPMAESAAVLAGAERVPGRFEPVDEGQPFAVLIDYAHTPDSLENALAAAREVTAAGRVICVFGCGGDRDRDKRPLMGEIGARGADLAVITSDNPRSEDPEAIIEEILAGARRAKGGAGELEVEPDRRAAIGLALAAARPGDTVLIAGKGHEQGQEFIGGRKLPFDDRDVAREELRRLTEAAGSTASA